MFPHFTCLYRELKLLLAKILLHASSSCFVYLTHQFDLSGVCCNLFLLIANALGWWWRGGVGFLAFSKQFVKSYTTAVAVAVARGWPTETVAASA